MDFGPQVRCSPAARPLLSLMLYWTAVSFSPDILAAQEAGSIRAITLPASYNDDSVTVAALLVLSRALPARSVQVTDGDSLAAILMDQYGFGPAHLPALYTAIQGEVLRLNGPVNVRNMTTGAIRIPELPRWQPSVGSELSYLNLAVVRSVKLSGRPDGAEGRLDSTTFARVDSLYFPARASATEYRRTLSLDREALQAVSDAADALEALGARVSLDGPVEVVVDSLNLEPAAEGDSVPSSEDLVSGLLARTRRRSTLFVLDTGWPTETARDSSAEALRGLINHVRRQRRIRDPVLPPLTFPAFRPPRGGHVSIVQGALADFTRLDPRNMVQVVYVPMTKDQHAEQILIELIYTYKVLSRVGIEGPSTVPDAEQDALRQQAKAVVEGMSEHAATAGTFRTVHEVLNAIWMLADYAASTGGQYYTISTSWVVPNALVRPYVPGSPAGVLLAAAGNKNERVVDDRLDLARRGSRSRDIIAVMNVRNGRVVCGSGRMSTVASLDKASVVGFDGRLAGRGCSTSAATPRVAWILSLDQALERRAPSTKWADELQDRLLASREPAKGLDGVGLNIQKFFASR